MKKRIRLLFLILFGFSLITAGCRDDEHTECFTPPAEVIFEFVDPAGNNLIGNGELKIRDIRIRELIGAEQTQDVIFVPGEDNRITVSEIGWHNGVRNYSFESPLIDFGFSVKSSKITDGCNGYRIDSIEFSDARPVLGAYGIYSFVID